MTPSHGELQCLLARQHRPAAAGEEPEPVVEGGGDPDGRHHANPGGGQFDGQGQAVEVAADLCHRLGVRTVGGEPGPDLGRSLHEKADPCFIVEGRHPIGQFPGHPQRLAAGGQDP